MFKLLTSNDERGVHAPSWYNATVDTPTYDTLSSDITSDVCVIGAGYTGLSTALHLRKQGHNVCVLDAHRVGWGASGRNGGQLGSGLNIDQSTLENKLGIDKARAIWQVCENAKSTIHSLCSEYNIDAKYKPGIISAAHRKRFLKGTQEYCDQLASDYGYTQLEPLTKSAIQELIDSPNYFGGILDHGAGHIHPLALVAGLAKAAHSLGVQIFEQTQVLSIDDSSGNDTIVKTEHATVRAPIVVLACNGYLDGLNRQVQQRVMPINNFMVATEPLGERASQLLSGNHAVFDSRFVVNYFRLSHDNRLIFGGGETYGYKFPDNIEQLVRKPLTQVFPQLKQVKIDYAWGGTLAITRNRAPYVRRLNPKLYCATGYSGHGVALSVEAGKLIAESISAQASDTNSTVTQNNSLNTQTIEGFDALASLECARFPGGTGARSLLLKGAMSFYAMLDKV